MFVIDRFETRDLLAVMKLASATLEEQYPPEFYLRLAEAQGRLFRVARDARTGSILGFVAAAEQPGLTANLLVLAVDADWQGRGIGQALVRSIQRTLTLDNVKELDLEVRSDNRRALEFYRRQGFEVAGFEAGVYKDGSDALALRKLFA